MKKSKPIFVVLLLLCISCNSNSGQLVISQNGLVVSTTGNANNSATKAGNQPVKQITVEDCAAFFTEHPLLVKVKKELDSFYFKRTYRFAWFNERGMIKEATNLFNHINNIGTDGLDYKIPYIIEFSGLLEHQPDSLKITAEIMLTAQYLLYAQNVWAGLSENETTAMNWYLPRKNISYTALLDSLINGFDLLNNPPVYRQYALLKDQLRKFRVIEKAGGFPLINSLEVSLKKSDSGAIVNVVRRWLFIAGDLTENNARPYFDDILETAIRRFQQRSGIKIDGKISSALIKEMNVPIKTRIQQIVLNMERSRWVPVSGSGDYLVVNIPEFKLHAYEHDSLVWSMDAVVGKPVHNTIIFSGKIQYIVFSPYWNIPPGILKNEILPAIRRDKNYLLSQNMEWHKGQVRQRSGPGNALGLVKFLFPNNYNIYLHDTPSKSLFGEFKRAFSHGCIRLSDAGKMANYLLKDDQAWNAQKINTAMHSGKEAFVTLQKTELVYIVYFTAWVDSGGALNFRNDLYSRDQRLAGMLSKNNVL